MLLALTLTLSTATSAAPSAPAPLCDSLPLDPSATPDCDANMSAASSTPSTFKTRQVDKTILSVEQSEGVGARVRRSIGRPELRNFDPFLMLDEFRVTDKGGFPDHPHRGFETVTYMLPTSSGAFEHEDFTGNRGLLAPATLQWMTAGRGIVHSEMPKLEKGQIAHGLQLWVNLAAKDKMCEPRYQELPKEEVPTVVKDGITAHVIAGTALGTTSPVYTRTPVEYIHFLMEPRTTLHHAIPKGFNSFIYSLEGEISVGSEGKHKPIAAHHTITLTSEEDADGVTVSTGEQAASFVLLAGKPLNEPIVQHGPFVMNTRQQIMEAMYDYQLGRNGFENAPGWRSEIGRPITDHMH